MKSYTLMNEKLWGKSLGMEKKIRQKREKTSLTLFEQASPMKADAEFQREHQVGRCP